MNKFVGPGYTLDEAGEILELRQSELAHLIRAGDIAPVAYSKLRPMLLLYKRDDGETNSPTEKAWEALGTFFYRGHIELFTSAIRSLVDGESVTTEKNELKILEVDGISSWSSIYPYKHPVPFDKIMSWRAIKFPGKLALRLTAIPFPSEFRSWLPELKHMSSQFESLNAGKISQIDTSAIINPDPMNMSLDYRKNSEFSPSDLRIPKSELDRFISDQATELTKGSNASDIQEIDSNSRENQLHTLIAKIIEASPRVVPKEIWRVLERECKSTERQFDSDYILKKVDSEEILWSSRYGHDQILKFTSLSTTVGNIKKKMTLSK